MNEITREELSRCIEACRVDHQERMRRRALQRHVAPMTVTPAIMLALWARRGEALQRLQANPSCPYAKREFYGWRAWHGIAELLLDNATFEEVAEEFELRAREG